MIRSIIVFFIMFYGQLIMSKHLPAVIINDSPEKSVFIYYDLNALLNQTDVSLEPHESHIIEFDSTSLSVVMVFGPASLTCLGLGFPIMER